ncbi:uncharacterized protein PITG_14386 [Phytophthora infestans T30-4]|uniref:Uncharacterized protein n=1 Tax=Phytophthora infestans (strain T30-4) TaxID=403677 RepID=D0NPQ3_PHYIT|nr:uncharacterized protein PITG_14386 [Phytophthora infestans T30-4]EEY62615.1 hypothetical protein PITG_14386 [Phytophthora infestans T30-4]|eukprot:XP_002898857.1 hypothetical protein PITG_14386 [Phytophthora infestans T30-4]
MVQWLLENRSGWNIGAALGKAAKSGHLRVAQCLAPRGSANDLIETIRQAASREHFEISLFLYDTAATVRKAVRGEAPTN